MSSIMKISKENQKEVEAFFQANWGSSIIVSRGKIHHANDLSGYILYENNHINGLITYFVDNKECEIVSLDSLSEKKGNGTKLLNLAINAAKNHNCNRVCLMTTNDNTNAIRYYQKRGFMIKDLYLNAIERSRAIKPEIPLYGFDGIPILHEIEFELLI